VWVNRPGSIWTNRFFISGNGAEGRGVIRTEQGGSFQGEIILTANAGIGSDGIGTTTTLNGNISGPFVLTLGGLTGANATNIYVLTGNNIHSATVIGLGITRIDRDVALGAYNGTTTIQTGATLQAGAAGIVLNPDRTIALTRGGLHYLDSQTYGISIEGTITGGASDTLVLRGGGHRLSATSSYAGATVIEGSTVTVETLANAGLPSSLGQGSPAPSAADLTLRDATVRVIPSAAVSTNRLFTLDGSGATLESSAASPLNTVSFTNPGPIALGDPAAHRFVLGGTNTGDNIFTPSLRDAVALPEPLRIGLTKTGVENAITLQEPIRTGLTKTGPGTWVLNGLNTFTDTTIIEGGTLVAASEGALGGTSGITVQTGGTLLLSNPATTDRINNAARMTLAGGRIAIDGNVTEGSSPGIGALTLTVDSTIDFAGGDGSLHFSDSHAESWTGTLSIYNWTSGSDHLLIGTVDHPWNLTDGGLTTSQLAQIEFYSGAGSGFLGTGQFIAGGFGQVVPVPEPSNIFAVLTLLGLAAASRSCSSPRESKKPTHAMPRAATGDVGCRSGASRKG
jgi:autotransporter-associated beta strand protein